MSLSRSASRAAPHAMHPIAAAVALAIPLLLGACGGTPSTIASGTATVSSSDTFPTGLSVGSPTELSNSTLVASAAPTSGLRYALDFGRATWTALTHGDTRTLGRLATALVPAGRAYAATAVHPDLMVQAAIIDLVLSGDTSITLDSVLDMNDLFRSANNASCYGPNLAYSSHENAGGGASSGVLPSGDLGLWTATQGATQPCIAAELNARVAGVKGRAKQGLALMAVMRLTVADNSLSMPASGASLDIQAELQAALAAVPALSSITIDAATIALDAPGAVYTYRVVVSGGSGISATSGEIVMQHTPGSSDSVYSGVMRIAGFHLSNDGAFSCIDEVDSGTGRYKVAQVSTLKYSRNGAAVEFGSRDGQYCGHPSGATSDYASEVASFTVDGQLDPTVKITGNTRGGGTGWRAGFTRFAASFDKDTVAGDFLFAWQAGSGDGYARTLAAHADYNSATEARSLTGYFGFADDVATTDGSLLGMICNWAGPGNNHTPVAKFQSQTATLTSSASEYTLDSSKITYAPTINCSSTTTAFDVDVSGAIDGAEGVGVVADLDVPSGILTVQEEIESRGFAKPSLF